MEPQSWTPFFGIAGVGLAAALAASVRVRLRAAAMLGAPLHVRRGDLALRILGLLALGATSFWLVSVSEGLPPLALGTVALATACLVLWPGNACSVCGSEGVQRGWTVRSFGELEEWRLAGEHLRFRVGERWLAVELPGEHHEAARARLQALVPERESRFR